MLLLLPIFFIEMRLVVYQSWKKSQVIYTIWYWEY